LRKNSLSQLLGVQLRKQRGAMAGNQAEP